MEVSPLLAEASNRVIIELAALAAPYILTFPTFAMFLFPASIALS
jgi:hypothetical protein